MKGGRERTAFAALSVPWFGSMWVSGGLWNISRWIAAFLGAYVINDLTDSPRLVQLTGTTLWAPLLLGGVAGGVVADRFDRRKTLLTMLGAIIPGALILGTLAAADLLVAWMVYPFLVLVGVGWVGDMTSRRTMVFDVVGERHLDNAMALEGVSLACGMTIGNLIGGSVIEFVGVSAAYFGMAGFLAIAFAVLWRVPPSRPKLAHARDVRSAGRDLAEGVRLVRHYPVVVSVLGVTIVANGFLFSYFPIIQRLGGRMDVNAALIGLLAGTSGLGMMTGSFIVAKWRPHRRGLVYVGGTLSPRAAAGAVRADRLVPRCGGVALHGQRRCRILRVDPERARDGRGTRGRPGPSARTAEHEHRRPSPRHDRARRAGRADRRPRRRRHLRRHRRGAARSLAVAPPRRFPPDHLSSRT